MARPRSDDKRTAILEAALAVFAQRGVWSTPTSAISRKAKVAEGTLFTYFRTKEVLMNELYRLLKRELAELLLSTFPQDAEVREKFRHIWDGYVRWGAAHPDRFKVMVELRLSDKITAESRAVGREPFVRLERLAQESIRRKLIGHHSVAFVAAMMGGMAELTIGFMAQGGKKRKGFCASGFAVFWNGITHS